MKRRNEVVMSPTPDLTRSGKKRARMGGLDKTPEGPTPRKRKPVTRTRTTLRQYFTANKDKENKPDEVRTWIALSEIHSYSAKYLVSFLKWDEMLICPFFFNKHTCKFRIKLVNSVDLLKKIRSNCFLLFFRKKIVYFYRSRKLFLLLKWILQQTSPKLPGW